MRWELQSVHVFVIGTRVSALSPPVHHDSLVHGLVTINDFLAGPYLNHDPNAASLRLNANGQYRLARSGKRPYVASLRWIGHLQMTAGGSSLA